MYQQQNKTKENFKQKNWSDENGKSICDGQNYMG